MAGRKPFSGLQAQMSQEAQAATAARSAELEAEMTLADLRRAMALSQEELAAVLNISQGSVAKMEKRADMLVGTLRRFIEAMGGELEIVARLPGGDVRIDQFATITPREPGETVRPDPLTS